ncbi:unnamed protein product [Wickerhamomyces anomalus]
MAKKKKQGNKSKQKGPLPQKPNVNTEDHQQVPNPPQDNLVPNDVGEVGGDGTDQESGNEAEKQSEEYHEEVPRDESLENEVQDRDVQLDVIEHNDDKDSVEANKDDLDTAKNKTIEDSKSVDDTTKDDDQENDKDPESNQNQDTEDNKEDNVKELNNNGDNSITKQEKHRTNGEYEADETQSKSEETAEESKAEQPSIDTDHKQETEHLEVSSNPIRPSISVLSDEKGSASEDSIINESKSELHLETLKSVSRELPLHNPDINGSENAYPTYVEKLDDHIYIGTSHGEILHFFKIENDFILVSRNSFHQSRIRPITKILLLPKIEKALVLAGGLLSCFLLPEFSPANIGRVKEVNDISLDFDNKAKNDSTGVHVTVYTKNQIRIINVTPTALRLVKDIAYTESTKGLRRSEYSLVASKENYDLIDLENFQKIPLFPILTVQDETGNEKPKLDPFILPVGQDEFLLTCGISKDEPSMGLVININGDVSRGTIPLAKYPVSMGINYPHVVSSFGSSVIAYSLHDQSEAQSIEFSGDVKVINVSSAFTEPYEDLVDLIKLSPLIGEDPEREVKELEFVFKISTITTSLVCYCSNFIKILLPQPRLIRLQTFQNVEELEDELKSVDGSTELGVIELEYINLLIGLTHLKNKTYSQAFEIWTNGTVDPRILIYIFKYEVYGEVWCFNGLQGLIEEVRKLIKDNKFKKFFASFLDKWISKESYTENADIVKSVELANLRESLSDNSKDHGKHLALAKIYMKQGKFKEVLQIYKELEDNQKQDDSFKKGEGLTMIIDLVYKHFSDDEDLIWDIGLWLINKKPELGLNFFQHDGLKINIKDETLLISKIDDISLKYKYIEKLLVRLNKDKMRSNLVKNLHKTELKSLNERIRKYKSHTNQ